MALEHLLRHRRIEPLATGAEGATIPSTWTDLLPPQDLLVAIPDLHMFVHDSPQDNFRFGAPALRELLYHLVELKEQLAAGHGRLHVYQLGDLFELCYPAPETGRPVTVDTILASSPLYREIFGLFEKLETTFILGNHDYDFGRTRGLAFAADCGDVYLEHGFEADRWYQFSNPHCPLWRTAMAGFGLFRRLEDRWNALRRALNQLAPGDHAAYGVVSGDRERRTGCDVAAYPRHRRHHYAAVMRRLLRQGRRFRLCLAAHSHRPLIDTTFLDGDCWFVDAGAWTEGRSDFVVVAPREVHLCRFARQPIPVEPPERIAVGQSVPELGLTANR